MIVVKILSLKNNMLTLFHCLNEMTGFLKLLLSGKSVCMFVCLFICVSTLGLLKPFM